MIPMPMIPMIVSQVLLIALAGLLVWAAMNDAHSMLIPNRISAAVVGLWFPYVAAQLVAGGAMHPILLAPLVALGVFAAGIVLFARGMMGGGDVKLLAGVTLWAGPELVVPFVLITLLAGGLIALALFAARLLRDLVLGPPAGAVTLRVPVVLSNALRSTIPFGVAIAVGGLFVACRLMFGPLSLSL